MGVADGTGSSEWFTRMARRNLPKPVRSDQVPSQAHSGDEVASTQGGRAGSGGGWFGQLVGSRKKSPLAALEQGLKRQLELLRDEIAQARSAGLSWSAIGAMVGLHPDVVRSIHAE